MSLYLFLAVFLWAFSYIAIKEALNYLDPVELIAARFVLGAATLLAIIKYRGYSLSFHGQVGKILISGGIVFVHFWIMATGMQDTSASNTAWILATAPIFIALLAALTFKEKLGWARAAGIIVATAGIIILVSKGDPGRLDWISSKGDWIVLSSCLTWAVYTIYTRKITERVPPLVATFWMIALAGLIVLPLSLVTSGVEDYLMLPARGMASVLFLGIGCLALAFWFWSEGVARSSANTAGMYLYLEPFLATAGGALLLREPVTYSLILGGVLILGAVYISENLNRVYKVSD